MYERTIFKELKNTLTKKQIIVLTGMRRVGKTTTLKYLFDQIESKNKIIWDLERIEWRTIFNERNYGNIINALKSDGLDLKEKTFIFLDEIQLVPNSTSVIKYLYDTYNIKFVVSGSSSFYLKNLFTESLAGRKVVYEMQPLDFGEFLKFKDVPHVFNDTDFYTFQLYEYNKLKTYYTEYLEFGGFPEVVLSESIGDKKKMLNDLLNSYLQKDVQTLADFSEIDEAFKLMKLLSSRVANRVDYSKLGSISGMNRHRIKDYMIFFEYTFFIRLVTPFVKNPDREIALQKKLYLSDNGLLNVLGDVSGGVKLENSIANQLCRKGGVNYYSRKNGQEIDFILNDKTAIEVKETPTEFDRSNLSRISEDIGLKQCFLTGLHFNGKFEDFIWAGSL